MVINIAKKKPKLELHVKCPYCSKAVVVRQFEEVLEKAVPAEKEIWVTAEKDQQSKLPK